MSDRKPCVDCNRNIDGTAKACPFCGWDQREAPRPRAEASTSQGPVAPPPARRQFPLQGRALAAVGVAALLVIIFVIGALVHGTEPEDVKAPTSTINAPRAETAPPQHSNIELVPTGTTQTQQPITSA